MKLKKLFLLRHGQYEGRGFLTVEGVETITKLSARMLDIQSFNPDETAVLCSGELRAFKTAQCLLGRLDLPTVEPIVHNAFFSNDRRCDTIEALKVLKKHIEECESLIVITHHEMMSALPHAFCSEVLGMDTSHANGGVSYGQGYCIDCENKTGRFIRG